MSITSLLLGVAVGLVLYPAATAGIKRVVDRIQKR